MLEIGCTALERSILIKETLAEKDLQIEQLNRDKIQQEQVNELLVTRLFNLRIDSLVQEAFTPEGLQDVLEYEEDVIEELKRGEWGVIRLDGRFVKHINTFGNLIGDQFLEHGGSEIAAITDGLVRTKNRRAQTLEVDDERRDDSDRRAGFSLGGDIICRQGGDEFSLVIRDVTPAELTRVAARVQSQLTVADALASYDDGRVPFIASVGSCHASELGREAKVALEQEDDLWAAFRDINGRADAGQRKAKSLQYEEMWRLTEGAMPPDVRKHYINQPEDSEVAKLFLSTLCPEFGERPYAFFTGRGNTQPQVEES
ncbi:MAG TPA: diguanylate cyclase [Candidatus Saccharimonadales bacterium]|nr:diguanylate cyclase [Candidatus Saccharimonadales bacterium]